MKKKDWLKYLVFRMSWWRQNFRFSPSECLRLHRFKELGQILVKILNKKQEAFIFFTGGVTGPFLTNLNLNYNSNNPSLDKVTGFKI